MKKFLKNKFNLTLVIVQAIALLFLCFCNLSVVFIMLAIGVEGVFFILYGVKYFINNKELNEKNNLLELLPMEDEEKKQMNIKESKSKKGNVGKALLFIFFGVILIFLMIFQ